MANYKSLKTTINANVKRNGNQEITGQILNSVLTAMVDTLGTGYSFAGVATPATNPGTPDAKVFYFANGKGTYSNFGSTEVTEDDVVVLYWDSSWHKVSTGIAREEILTELGKEVATKQDIIPDLDTIRTGAALGVSALQEETDPTVPSWAKKPTKPSYTPTEVGAASAEELQSHVDDNTRHITDTERAKWNAKQDALTLTIKDNGNIVLSNIQGQSKEFMPATPSGDPMHYAYVAAGAEYNDTGADIVKTTPWADLADDDADKTVIHKAGYWYLNGLGDLTNNDMLNVLWTNKPFLFALFAGTAHKFRTNICFEDNNAFIFNSRGACDELIRRNIKIEVLRLPISDNYDYSPGSANGLCNSSNVIHIINILNGVHISSFNNSFYKSKLRTIKIKNLKCNVSFNDSVITLKSVLYMITNEAATSAISITLNADAYARAMANADIVAALEAHPNVSLASA